MWSEQQRPIRMNFGAKEKWIKGANLGINGAIKIAHMKIEILHGSGDHISFIIFRNVSEVPNGPTAGRKEVSILRLTGQVFDHQSDNVPFFTMEGSEESVDTSFHPRSAFRRARDFAFEGSYHILSSIERSYWQTP